MVLIILKFYPHTINCYQLNNNLAQAIRIVNKKIVNSMTSTDTEVKILDTIIESNDIDVIY